MRPRTGAPMANGSPSPGASRAGAASASSGRGRHGRAAADERSRGRRRELGGEQPRADLPADRRWREIRASTESRSTAASRGAWPFHKARPIPTGPEWWNDSRLSLPWPRYRRRHRRCIGPDPCAGHRPANDPRHTSASCAGAPVDALRADFLARTGGDTIFFGNNVSGLAAPARRLLRRRLPGCDSTRTLQCAGSRGMAILATPGTTRWPWALAGRKRFGAIWCCSASPRARSPRPAWARSAGLAESRDVRTRAVNLSRAALIAAGGEPGPRLALRFGDFASAHLERDFGAALLPACATRQSGEIEPFFLRFDQVDRSTRPGRSNTSRQSSNNASNIAGLLRLRVGCGIKNSALFLADLPPFSVPFFSHPHFVKPRLTNRWQRNG